MGAIFTGPGVPTTGHVARRAVALAYSCGTLFVTLPLLALPVMQLLRREMMVPL